jgi:DNA-binding PadR family transcriptional regulator
MASETKAGTAQFLVRMEREMTTGFQHVLLLATLRRHTVLHGYGLIRALEETTAKGLWKEGTIYPVLANLEAEGIVKSRWGEGTTGARRKYYELTPAGRQVLRLARLQWTELRQTLDTLLEEKP